MCKIMKLESMGKLIWGEKGPKETFTDYFASGKKLGTCVP
jgi:hypothetical protein